MLFALRKIGMYKCRYLKQSKFEGESIIEHPSQIYVEQKMPRVVTLMQQMTGFFLGVNELLN